MSANTHSSRTDVIRKSPLKRAWRPYWSRFYETVSTENYW
jgi:hypothetical protein